MKTKKTEKRTRVFDSMASASSITGISIDSLRNMKERGCPAFRGSRVHEDSLYQWMDEHGADIEASADGAPLKDQKLAEEIRKLRIKNDRDEGKLVSRESVAASIRRILGPAAQILTKKIENEWPSAVAGQEVPAIRIYGKRLVDDIMGKFKELETEWK
jgi:phage terminase Nu1 subunit (DNA packaging protein)